MTAGKCFVASAPPSTRKHTARRGPGMTMSPAWIGGRDPDFTVIVVIDATERRMSALDSL